MVTRWAHRKTVLKFVFKKYGLSVNDHYRNVNITENIPEIDVQIHLSLTSHGRDQTNHESKIPELSWNVKAFIRRTDLKLPPDARVHCASLPSCTCPQHPLALVERSVCSHDGLNGFVRLVLTPIGRARVPRVCDNQFAGKHEDNICAASWLN